MIEKEKIYLTDITLHTKDVRPTINFVKAEAKGRMYSPLPKGHHLMGVNCNFSIPVQLPTDLQERLEKNEVQIMMPEDGLFIYAGKDIQEKLDQMKKEERRQLIHRNRDKFWRKE